MIFDTGFLDIIALSLVEIYGDFNLRFYAKDNTWSSLGKGVLGYAAVVYFLIRSLRSNNVLYVNGLWDGISGVLESVAAYYYLGDRLKNGNQYVGLVLIIAGVVLMKMGG
jgi:multidrug transporter EmrE-like cation transporter